MADLAGWTPRLVVSDIDGTFIDSAERVQQPLRDIVNSLAPDTFFTLATGRPPRWLHPILEQITPRPICVCGNGAVLYDSATDRVLRARALEPEVLRSVVQLARTALEDLGGCSVAVERAGQSAFDRVESLFAVTPEFIHVWESEEHGVESEQEILSEPVVKLMLRNDALTAKEMYARVAPAIPAELAHITYSIDYGLLEVSAPGVNKANGLADVAEFLGVASENIIAFGDMPNDIEMLQWVRHGVAMANAHPALQEVADEVTLSNDEGGVAHVLSRWF